MPSSSNILFEDKSFSTLLIIQDFILHSALKFLPADTTSSDVPTVLNPTPPFTTLTLVIFPSLTTGVKTAAVPIPKTLIVGDAL